MRLTEPEASTLNHDSKTTPKTIKAFRPETAKAYGNGFNGTMRIIDRLRMIAGANGGEQTQAKAIQIASAIVDDGNELTLDAVIASIHMVEVRMSTLLGDIHDGTTTLIVETPIEFLDEVETTYDSLVLIVANAQWGDHNDLAHEGLQIKLKQLKSTIVRLRKMERVSISELTGLVKICVSFLVDFHTAMIFRNAETEVVHTAVETTTDATEATTTAVKAEEPVAAGA
jgi:hypothetical protein